MSLMGKAEGLKAPKDSVSGVALPGNAPESINKETHERERWGEAISA